MSARKPFKPIDEVLDEVADRVAAANNIPTLTRPQPEPQGTAASIESKPTVRAAPPQPREHPEARDEKPSVSFFRVRCPAYLTDQLEMRRQELRRQGKNVTLSYLVMKALRADGYRIADEDFVEDGRRLRENPYQKTK